MIRFLHLVDHCHRIFLDQNAALAVGILEQLVRPFLSSLLFGEVFCSPGVHGVHDRFERQTKRGDLIFHFRRHFSIYCPRQEALFFHIPQLVREHFLRNAGNRPLEVGETLHSLEEIPQEHDLPSASDQVCGELCRTGKVRRHGAPFYQEVSTQCLSYHSVRSCFRRPQAYTKSGGKNKGQSGTPVERSGHHDDSTK
jgi:hypothetical protein